jgi:uncharacterized protein YbjT (DUF2867 family)
VSNIAIAGATGVVGRCALRALLDDVRTQGVVAVGRRDVDFDDPRVRSFMADFGAAESIAGCLAGPIDVGVCSLGTTRAKAGSAAAFRAVDLHAVVRFAEACRARHAKRFVLVSSLGANPNSPTLYLRTKGQAEVAVAGLGFDEVAIVRPSVIDDQGTRTEHRFGEKVGIVIGRAMFSVLGRTRRYAPVTADAIGRAVAAFALADTAEKGVTTIESEGLHRFAPV